MTDDVRDAVAPCSRRDYAANTSPAVRTYSDEPSRFRRRPWSPRWLIVDAQQAGNCRESVCCFSVSPT